MIALREDTVKLLHECRHKNYKRFVKREADQWFKINSCDAIAQCASQRHKWIWKHAYPKIKIRDTFSWRNVTQKWARCRILYTFAFFTETLYKNKSDKIKSL